MPKQFDFDEFVQNMSAAEKRKAATFIRDWLRWAKRRQTAADLDWTKQQRAQVILVLDAMIGDLL